tara:strand:- start:1203 stop:2138 length:936 start_codon:yes stop_codon:yes gene_type:complete
MDLIAGVDEAGRGPLAGPVVAAAVILPKNHNIHGLRDSKKLAKKKREELYPLIYKEAISVGIGEMDEKTIDKINIRQATFKAMQIALGKLTPRPDKALIDGEKLPSQIIPNIGIIGGDSIEDSIKAASIVAKVTRDRIMKEYSIIFPEYGFENHSGYGTKKHIEALDLYRSSPIHRQSFRPVKIRLPSFKWMKENNKTKWLGEKLAALYIKKRGMQIVGLNNNFHQSNINIHAMEGNIHVLVNVLTQIVVENSIIDDSILRNKSNTIRKTYSILIEKMTSVKKPFRFDFIVVSLKSKDHPSYQYFKDIIDI